MARRVRFYTTPLGGNVVRDEIAALNVNLRAAVAAAMVRLRNDECTPGENRHLTKTVREVRVRVDNQIARVLFTTVAKDDCVILALHAFEKKTQRTPKQAIDLASKRLADWTARGRTGTNKKKPN